MNDRAVALLERYDVEVRGIRKGRGAILCDTDKGCLIFKEYAGKEERIRIQNELLNHIAGIGKVAVEQIFPTKEGELLVYDGDRIPYVLKTYREGRECNIYDQEECMDAVKLLARLHECTTFPCGAADLPPAFSPAREYEKHNRELKKVRRYLLKRSQKTWFEICLLNTYNVFLEQALAVTEEWKCYQTEWETALEEPAARCSYCHGDYQYHNILRSQGDWFLVNFEKCVADDSIRDLYLLMRKLLEKSNWSVPLGKRILATYEKERPISALSRIDLYYRLAYPEKFWKIANFYYNSGKAWIPDRNREKLEKLIRQEPEKQHFLEEVFRDVTGMC